MSKGQFRLAFYARDYESTVGFYRDGLELTIIRRWDRGPDDKGALFGAASGLIEVLQNPPGREFVPPQGAWAYFEVDDVDNQYHRVLEKGLPVKRELTSWPWGHRGFSVIDPNGLELVLFSVTS